MKIAVIDDNGNSILEGYNLKNIDKVIFIGVKVSLKDLALVVNSNIKVETYMVTTYNRYQAISYIRNKTDNFIIYTTELGRYYGCEQYTNVKINLCDT